MKWLAVAAAAIAVVAVAYVAGREPEAGPRERAGDPNVRALQERVFVLEEEVRRLEARVAAMGDRPAAPDAQPEAPPDAKKPEKAIKGAPTISEGKQKEMRETWRRRVLEATTDSRLWFRLPVSALTALKRVKPWAVTWCSRLRVITFHICCAISGRRSRAIISMTCQAAKFEMPKPLALPAAISSSNAASVSSIGMP